MWNFLIVLLSTLLVLDCVLLILLVLAQLPKKEAGIGMAFGSAATDAIFGAGSGTVLTAVTRWVAIFFFVIAVALGVSYRHANKRTSDAFKEQYQQAEGRAPAAPIAPTNLELNLPTAPATNRAPAPAAVPGATNGPVAPKPATPPAPPAPK